MMISRRAGTVSSRGPVGSRKTRGWASSGIQRDTGSLSRILPCSICIRAATEVIGFVMEAMRNSVSGRIGTRDSMSLQPMAAEWTISPCREASVTMPGSSPASTNAPQPRLDGGERLRIEAERPAGAIAGHGAFRAASGAPWQRDARAT
jgi:hypothetical protein